MKHLLVIALTLCGCSTSYQKGIKDVQVSPDKYVVSFEGNKRTSPEDVRDYVFRRAEEVCIEHGFQRYQFIETASRNSYEQHSITLLVQCLNRW